MAPLSYLATLILAELVVSLINPLVGVGVHVLLLLTLVLHAAVLGERPEAKLYLALTLAPLTRILSLSMPLSPIPLMYWYAVVSAPLLLAALVAVRVLGYPWRSVGLTAGNLPLQTGVALLGIPLGMVEYLVLRPDPMAGVSGLGTVLLAGLILLVGTGFVEELVFRGILQKAALENWKGWGLVYVSVVFAALHLGYLSALELVFVFAVGLFFAIIVARSGSILGTTLAHGVLNFALFVGVPLWLVPALPGSLAQWLEPPVQAPVVELLAAVPERESPALAILASPAAGYQRGEAVTPGATPTALPGAATRTITSPAGVTRTATPAPYSPQATTTATPPAKPATPTSTSIAIAPPRPAAALKVRTPDGDGLNLRNEAGLTGLILQLLENGSAVTWLGYEARVDNQTWWLVATPDSVIGWAFSDYLAPAN